MEQWKNTSKIEIFPSEKIVIGEFWPQFAVQTTLSRNMIEVQIPQNFIRDPGVGPSSFCRPTRLSDAYAKGLRTILAHRLGEIVREKRDKALSKTAYILSILLKTHSSFPKSIYSSLGDLHFPFLCPIRMVLNTEF